jgi:S-adenosylmethionine decarboxylase
MNHRRLHVDATTRDSVPVAHFGVHLTIDGYLGSPEKLSDGEHIRSFLAELPERIGMHKIAEPVLVEVGKLSDKDSGGFSGFVLIAESHISVHTFPLRGFISADVYTCQNVLDVTRICDHFTEAFGLGDIETNVVTRGTRYPQHDIYGGPAAEEADETPLPATGTS